MLTTDTIAAISSPPGAARRGIIRLSGPLSWDLAEFILVPIQSPTARRWINVTLRNPQVAAGAIFFRAPASFTGQDAVELHLPGAVPLLQRVLAQFISAGARSAGPGEFSARAYLNGKCDLTEAEGIAAAIAATNDRQLLAAQSLRCGLLHEWTRRQTDALADLLAMVEAGIDFSDEPGVSFISGPKLQTGISELEANITNLLNHAAQWETQETLPTAFLIGPANVGKSSLINRLSGRNRAIVSSQAGTTRDSISVTVATPFGSVRIVDTPGLENAGHHLYPQMDEFRHKAIQRADLLVLILDPENAGTSAEQLLGQVRAPAGVPWLLVQNKADLCRTPAPPELDQPQVLRVSALTGQGTADLLKLVGSKCYQQSPVAAESILLNHRHRTALGRTLEHLGRAANLVRRDQWETDVDLTAGDLRAALNEMGTISGTIGSDDILGRIFGQFCIGK